MSGETRAILTKKIKKFRNVDGSFQKLWLYPAGKIPLGHGSPTSGQRPVPAIRSLD